MLSVISFAENTYTITYDYGAASAAADRITDANPRSYDGKSELTLASPECEGFEFVGWYLENNFKTPVTKLNGADGDITLYAKWYEESYNINYILSLPDDAVITNSNPSSRLMSETVKLNEPVCENGAYIFLGWYLNSEYTQKIETINEYTCEDITVYAKWRNAEFKVEYDLGDIETSLYPVANLNPDSYEYGSEITLVAPESDDLSFNFDGWYEDEFYIQPITEISSSRTGDIRLYAKWSRTVYSISYELSGAAAQNANPEARNAGEEIVLSAPVPQDKSLAFAGWFTSPDFDEASRVTTITADMSGDITLYAKWEEAVYSINYDYGNINLLMLPIENGNPTQYRFGEKIELLDIEADGYIFNGWCTDKSLKNKITAVTDDMYGDITLYADFTEKTYTINYILDDKEVKANQVVNTNQAVRMTSQSVKLGTPQTMNLEYSFGGWYLDKEFTTETDEIRAYTAQNITVYAKWVRIVSYLPVWGDATLSDKLSAADARLILRYSASLEPSLSDLQLRLADLNNDSAVNAADARLCLRLSAGLETEEELMQKYSLMTIALADGEVVFL